VEAAVGAHRRSAGSDGSEVGDEDPDANADAERRARYERMPERQLVWAMRARDRAALEEFFRRFSPALHGLARSYRVAPGERDAVVTELLDDTAWALLRDERPIPRSLTAYVVASFVHGRGRAARSAARADGHQAAATGELGCTGERAVLSASSEYSARASAGPAWEPQQLAPALARLVARVEDGLSEQERMLLLWSANDVTLRQIAEWLGIDRSAAKLRVWRLRMRLHRASLAYAESVDPAERAALDRFFRRAAAPAVEALAPRARERGRSRVAEPPPPAAHTTLNRNESDDDA
jgi:hypothetical protein